jgi:hypothetical protein
MPLAVKSAVPLRSSLVALYAVRLWEVAPSVAIPSLDVFARLWQVGRHGVMCLLGTPKGSHFEWRHQIRLTKETRRKRRSRLPCGER